MNFDQMLKRSAPVATPAASNAVPGLVIGGLPAVSLLPTELRSAVQERAVKQVLAFSLLTAVLVTGVGVGLAGTVAGNAQTRLEAAQVVSQDLQRQIGKFADVQKLQRNIALGEAAVKVGGSTEIDWQAQIDAIEQDMPAGFVVTGITADSATPVVDYPQGTTPLERPRAATVQLTAVSTSITQLPVWLRKLRSIPAYADAEPSITYDPEQGYTVQLTMHLSQKAIISAPAQGSDR